MAAALAFCLALLWGQAWATVTGTSPYNMVPANELLSLSTTYQCNGTQPEHTVCTYHNLVIAQGEVYCVQQEGQHLTVPHIQMEGPTGLPSPAWHCKVVSPRQLHSALANASVLHAVPAFPFALVAHRKDLYNYFHAFAENLVNFHYHICKYFGLCDFSQAQLQETLMVFLDGEPQWQYPAVRDALRCMTAHKTVLLPSGEGLPAPFVLLRQAVVGQEAACFRVGHCGPQYQRPAVEARYLQAWRQRLLHCLHMDPGAEVRALQQPMVTYVQRRYEQGRSIINLLDVVQDTQRLLPGYTVRTVYLEELSLMDTARVFQSTSVVVCYHGAAMANAIFLRRHAAYIDISPYHQRHMFINYMMLNWAPVVALKFLQYDVQDPFQVAMNWRHIVKSQLWQEMTPQQRLQYVETRKCPRNSECLVTWRNWKAEGAVVDFKQMGGLLNQAAAWLQSVQPTSAGDLGTAALPAQGGAAHGGRQGAPRHGRRRQGARQPAVGGQQPAQRRLG